MNIYLPILCIVLLTTPFAIYAAIQSERRRQAAIAQRKAKRAHDDSVRKDYGYYNTQTPYVLYSVDKRPYLPPYECLNEETREIPTIEAENTEHELSDVWVNAIEGLEIE